MMTPPPRRALVFHIGGVEFVLRPGALILFGGIATALDLSYYPLALPAQSPSDTHLLAAATMVLMIVAVLLHETGHAVAYRLQGIWPVRITLRGSGGGCAAVVYDDSPLRALLRALAGPAVTAMVVLALAVAWHTSSLPESWRLVAATLFVFGLFDLVFNTLPVHPRSDGVFALRAFLWLVRGQEAEAFAVLYLWRPVILAAAVLALSRLAIALDYLTPVAVPLASGLVLALCAVPPVMLIRRHLTGGRQRAAVG